jgi:phospholipid/cholesterol/gamma-HCH transport system substrate-binding protein
MRTHNLNYVAVGLFIIAMVAAAVASAALLTGRVGPRDTYYTLLDNVADVKFGTQVRYEGFPIGQVEEITPVAEGARMRFRLRLGLQAGWRIPVDSIARIGSTSFLAAKTIDIQRGRAETAIATGGEISGGAPSDMFAAMAGVAAEFGDLNRDNLKPLVEQIAGIVERMGGDLERDMGQILGSLVALAEVIETRTPPMIDRVDVLVGRLDSSAQGLQQVLSSENTESIERLIGNAEDASELFKATSVELSGTLTTVNSLVTRLDQLARDNQGSVDQSIRDVQYTLGAVARSISPIVQNLEATSRNMSEFSRLIRRNPSLLLGGEPAEEVSVEGAAVNGMVQ